MTNLDAAEKRAALVLAAGKGTRMRSPKPKVLHTLLGEPMLALTLAALEPIFGANILVVAGHRADLVESAFPDAHLVIQREQLGTGHALMTAMTDLEKTGAGEILVANGDAPLVTTRVFEDFIARANGADIAFATITLADPGAYGRVIRANGKVKAIVEARELAGNQQCAGNEVNAGIYLFRFNSIKNLLPRLKNANSGGEYYLTDLIGLGVEAGLEVSGIQCGSDAALLGVNSPKELAAVEEILRASVTNSLLEAGVIIHAPSLTRVSPLASIAPGAEITGPCEIFGRTGIAAGAVIDSHCVIINSRIGENARVRSFSHLEDAVVGPGAIAGPYARLRPGAIMESNSHVGNFVELKKTRIGAGSKANHLTYLGDTEIGANVNVGAGTITCNYDGKNKFRTTIGDDAFIGSNTSLVAPVSIGSHALIGAGSVITRDVPENELGISRARQKNIPRRLK